MTHADPQSELAYHLRELRADLRSVVDALVRARDLEATERDRVRAWVEVEALLEHDADVHVKRARALIGAPAHAVEGVAGESRAIREAQDLARAADDTRRLAAGALDALGTEPVSADSLEGVGDAIRRAHAIAARARAGAVRRARLR